MKAKQQAALNRVEALRHELRARILRYLIKHGPSSPSEIATAFDERLDRVNHHMKRLAELECAELIREERSHGSMKHVYRATERYLIETEEWEALDPAVKEYLVAEFAQAHIDDMVAGFQAGMLGADRHFHLTEERILVDVDGRDEVLEILGRARQECLAAQDRAGERLAAGAEPLNLSLLVGGFEVPLPDEDSHPDGQVPS